MKKIIVLSLLINLIFVGAWAQHTQVFTNSDAQFNQGKELFLERKFAASYRCFEEFQKSSDASRVGQKVEADYYLAANAYELRQKDADVLLKNHLLVHPYTPFSMRLMICLDCLSRRKRIIRRHWFISIRLMKIIWVNMKPLNFFLLKGMLVFRQKIMC